MEHKSTYNSSKSLNKAISVLKSFSPQVLELGPAEVARKVGISRATAHRILTTLAANGLLDQDKQTRKYTIGPSLYFLGNLYSNTRDTLKVTEPVIKELNELTGEGLNVSVFDKGFITVIMRALAKSDYRYDRPIGTISPAYSSSMGKAFLSELTKAEFDDLYPGEKLKPITKKTITSKAELKASLEDIRKTGIAFSREEGTDGINGIASVIRDSSGKARAAISFQLPTFKADENTRKLFATLVKMGASLISYRMGYMDSPVHDIKEIHTWWEKDTPI